jgi:drug/metabolite transporter (DMT)-like permease
MEVPIIMKTKGQKAFAIVNIIVGVILVLASFNLFADPSTGAGGLIAILIGGVFWGVGAYTIRTLKKYAYDEVRVKKSCVANLVCFILSCIVVLCCTVLPILGSMGSL